MNSTLIARIERAIDNLPLLRILIPSKDMLEINIFGGFLRSMAESRKKHYDHYLASGGDVDILGKNSFPGKIRSPGKFVPREKSNDFC